MRISRRSGLLGVEVGATALIVLAIWFYTERNSSYAVPAMSDALQEFQRAWLFARFDSDVLPTLRRLVVGYATSGVLGVLLGLALGSSKGLRLFLQPLLSMIRATPAVALIPPLVILLGIGDGMMLVVVVIVCIWPIALNTCDGVIELDDTVRSTAHVFGLTRLERVMFVVIPGVSPRIMAGLRTSLSLALILVIASEYIVGTNGVGSFVARAQQTYDIAGMWAGIVLLGLLSYVLNIVFMVLQRRLLHWHASSAAR